jgi:hypothetical protein
MKILYLKILKEKRKRKKKKDWRKEKEIKRCHFDK